MIISHIKSKLFYLICLIPLALISGPAIPDIIISFLSLSFLFFFLLDINSNKEYVRYLLLVFIIYLFIFFGFINSGLLFSKSFIEASLLIRFFIFPIAFIFFIKQHSNNKINYLLFFSTFTLFLLSVDIIFQYFNNGVDLINSNFSGYYSGFFGEEKRSGFFSLIFVYLALIYLLLNKDNKFIIFFSILTILITIPSIFLSGEIISIFNFFLSITLLYVLSLIYFSKKFNLILLFSIFFVFFILVNSNIFSSLTKDFERSLGLEISNKNSFSSLIKEKIISANDGYLIIWKTVFKTQLDKKNLLFGNGPKTYENICLKNLSTNSSELNIFKCSNHPHNLLLQFTFSFGLLGTLFIYYFVINLVYKSFNSKKNNKILISLIPILLIIFSPHNTYNFFNNWTASQIWFFLSILIFFNYKKIIK